MNIIVLKTNIRTARMVHHVSLHFDHHPDIWDWHIDTEDIDNVLRIEGSEKLTEKATIRLLQSNGFYGETLMY